MSDERLDPRGIRPGGQEGDVAQIVGGVVTFAPLTPATAPDPLVTVVDGIPGFVFDGDGQIVYTELP